MSTHTTIKDPQDTLDPTVSSRIVAACFALAAFALALLSGLFAGNPTSTVLTNALFWLTACYILGLVIARIANTAVTERLAAYRDERPIPTPDATTESDQQQPEDTNAQADHAQATPAQQSQPATPAQAA